MNAVDVVREDSAVRADADNKVRALLREYVNAVDRTDLEAWRELFAETSSYVVTTRENEECGLPLAFVYDDSKDRIHDRVTYVTQVWTGHYNDYRQRHIISDASVTWKDDIAHVSVGFALYIAEPMRSGSRLLATGEYVDTVAIEAGVAKFRSKKVILDADVLPRYFVYPL